MTASRPALTTARLMALGLAGAGVAAILLAVRSCAPRQARDVCDLQPIGPSVTVCLLPGSDPRASGLEIGTDCYWQNKSIDKRLQGFHGGGAFTFRLDVVNKCTQIVSVELELERNNTLGFDACEGTSASGRVPLGDIAGSGGEVGKRCTTNRYLYEVGARRTTEYFLHATKVNGSLIPTVTYDPEVILEKAGRDQP